MLRLFYKPAVILSLCLFCGLLVFSSIAEQDSGSQPSGMTVDEYLATVNQEKPVLVYFNADWCVPCIKEKQIVESVKTENSEITVLTLNVDANPKVALFLEINALPLFIMYKKGKKAWDHHGFLDKKSLVNKIQGHR